MASWIYDRNTGKWVPVSETTPQPRDRRDYMPLDYGIMTRNRKMGRQDTMRPKHKQVRPPDNLIPNVDDFPNDWRPFCKKLGMQTARYRATPGCYDIECCAIWRKSQAIRVRALKDRKKAQAEARRRAEALFDKSKCPTRQG